MAGNFTSTVYYYGFWALGIICCLIAIFGIFVIVRAILRKDGSRQE